ncbi:ABC transporter permease [soil metagenome]
MLRATVKGLLAHKLRLALTALSVVLGVSFVSGTLVLTDTLRSTFDTLFADVNAGTDVSIRSPSGFEGDGGGGPFGGDRAPVPASIFDTVSRLGSVEAAAGTLLGYADLVDEQADPAARRPPTIGAAWVENPALNPFTLRSGRAPRGGGEVIIDAASAQKHGIDLGDEVRIVFQGPPGEFTVVGIAGFGEDDNFAGATLVAFDAATARRVLVKPEGFDSIEIAAAEGVSQAELRRDVVAVLGPGFEVVTGEAAAQESADRVKEDLGFFGTLLLIFAGVSLFVGSFIILNTFQILVAQRTRELGLLRALGASTAQVRTSVLAEAVLVGLVASVVGIGFGAVVAVGLQALLETAGIDLPTSGTELRSRTVVVSLAVGVTVTFLSALLPARRAARVPPVAAMRDEVKGDTGGSLRRRTVLGVVVSAIGFAVLLAGTAGVGNGAATVGIGAVVGFVGASLIAPVVARPVARVIGAPLAWAGFAGKLGRENAMRNPRRTAATAAALIVGLALVTLVTVFAASARKSTSRVIDDVFHADFVVAAAGGSASFSPEVAERLRQVPEVAVVAEFRQGPFRYQGEEESLMATDPAALGSVLELELSAGTVDDLTGGGVLVHEDEAEARDLDVGDVVGMDFFRTGEQPLRVAGVFGANEVTGDYFVALDTYEANFGDQLDTFAMVKLRDGVSPAAGRDGVDRVVEEFPSVELNDQNEFKAEVASQVGEILNLFYALLGLAILIAVLGIVNTLALSVFERTRELGLLRAVGTSRRQVRAMVRVEGAIIALLGAVLGLVIGVVVSLSMLQALREQGITETSVPSARLVSFVVLAAVAGMAAALLPARRAAKLNVLDAIAHE